MRLKALAVLFGLGVLLGPYGIARSAPPPPGPQALIRMQILSAQALADTQKARSAWHEGNAGALAFEIGRAATLLQLIRSYLPAAEFHAMLQATVALMNFEDNRQVLGFFPRLFHALDDLPPGAATRLARAALVQARRDLQTPNRAAALRALDRAGEAFSYPRLSPPLEKAEHALNAARQALDNGRNLATEAELRKLAAALRLLHHALATYPVATQGPP